MLQKTIALKPVFAFQISSSHAQSSLTEYILSALGSNGAPLSSSFSSGIPASYHVYGANYQNYPTPNVYTNPQKPNSPKSISLPKPLTAVANLAAAIPVSESLKTPAVPKASDVPLTPLDSNVLNNLAIALQLLIVSNILNTPHAESLFIPNLELSQLDLASKYETVPISPIVSYPVQSPMPMQSSMPYLETPSLRNVYPFERSALPNSKFMGSSGFTESPVYGSAITPLRSNPRSSMTLMSPYEALGPNSPFADPVLSSLYSSSYSKKDFQSPYASILAADGNRDLFSMNDFL